MNGGTGHVIEFRGSAIEAMSMDERMTVCNMSIEAGARAGMIAPDATTYEYLQGPALSRRPARTGTRPWPTGTRCAAIRARSSTSQVTFDASTLEPMITFGTNPGMVTTISGSVPERPGDAVFAKSLAYMGLHRRRAHGRQAGAGRLHRQLHQRAPLGPGSRRSHPARSQGRQGRARAGRAGLAADQAAKPSSAAWRRSSSTRAPNGASPAARCASA